jgi:hypothetical protein
MKDLLTKIYQYYPIGSDPIDPSYFDTPEAKNLTDALRSAEEKKEVWERFFSSISYEFGDKKVSEWTQLFNRDACYKLRICIFKSNILVKEMAVHISVISHYFSIYVSSFNMKNRFNLLPQNYFISDPEELECFECVKKIIGEHFVNYRYLNPETAVKPVAGIAIDNQHFGQVNIFNCLFTTHIW